MAGDWIAFDHDLPDKAEVIAICAETKTPLAEVILRLCRFWIWMDRHTESGRMQIASAQEAHKKRTTSEQERNKSIMAVALVCGGDDPFWAAVEAVGWIKFQGGDVICPGFTKRFGASARRRLLAAKRMQASRTAQQERNRSATEAHQEAHPQPQPQPQLKPPSPSPKTATNSDPETATNRGGEGGGNLDGTGGEGPIWEDAVTTLKLVGVRFARQLADEAAALGIPPDQVIGIADVYRLNAAKLKLGPGAIAFRIRQGSWPADGVVTAEEAEAKRRAENERPDWLKQIDAQKKAFEEDREGARRAIQAAKEAIGAKAPKPEERPDGD